MNSPIASTPVLSIRTTYQTLAPHERERAEKFAVENPQPFKGTQPAMPTRVAPAAPGTVVPVVIDSVIQETPVNVSPAGTSWASRLGAKLGVVKDIALTFLRKIVGYIVAAAQYVVGTVSAAAQYVRTGLQSISADKPVATFEMTGAATPDADTQQAEATVTA